MSARGFKLRSVIVWMALTLLVASLPLGMVWKHYAYVNLSRGLLEAEKRRSGLGNEVLLLETELRRLKDPARLESLARERFGLKEAGPPVLVPAEGQVLAQGGPGKAEDAPRAASWQGARP
jgi:hypothetical protein